jgi:hypothetical protein
MYVLGLSIRLPYRILDLHRMLELMEVVHCLQHNQHSDHASHERTQRRHCRESYGEDQQRGEMHGVKERFFSVQQVQPQLSAQQQADYTPK